MSERSMTEALAVSRAQSEDADLPKSDILALKARALESPQVNSFIKEGAVGAAPEAGRCTTGTTAVGRVPAVQLNARIPEDLHQRAKRAVFENESSNADPRTLQDLVTQALHAELRRLGY